jgi:replication-associated recombination protein RarA
MVNPNRARSQWSIVMLYETYRPRQWADMVGQDRAVTVARRIVERDGFDRGAFWIGANGQNNSGVGKTSLAWVIAHALAEPFFITVLKGRNVDVRTVKDMERSAWLCVPSDDRPFRVWIVEEAHQMTQGAVDLFLTFLEGLPPHCVVIFTSTRPISEDLFGEDAGPFGSRCHVITLTNQGLAQAFAERARTIADREGLNGRPIGEYVKLAQRCHNNLRAMLQAVEEGDMLGGAA